MKISTANEETVYFNTSLGQLTMAQTARAIRIQAGFETPGHLERSLGVDHPRWCDLEKGKWKSPRLILEVMIELGYEINVTKRGEG